ncbi:MAG: ABC transporter substrate-binding protein [Eubacteriales bacterium]|nr:ABC transporter substrate-binding protein [Eubacteriales bacterium]
MRNNRQVKHAAAFIMAGAICSMALTGCGSKAAAETTGSTTTAGTAAETSADSTDGNGEESAFIIGSCGPITGATAIYGTAVKNGAELAVKEINEAGGIDGHPIRFLFEDDENDPEKGVNAYNTMKDNGMQILIGATTAGPTLAIGGETEKDNMFQIAPSATAKNVTKPKNVFRMTLSGPVQGGKIADYIADNELAEKVGILYDNSDVYSGDIYQEFAKHANEKGLDLVAVETFTSDSKTDFRVQLTKLKDAGADLVFMPVYYTEASLILKQARDMDYAPQFFGGNGMDGILDIPNFDKSLAEGLILVSSFAADMSDPAAAKFVNDYKEYSGGIAPLQFSAEAYDCVYAIKEAIEEAGITPEQSVSEIGDALEAAMPSIQYDGLTGQGITFSEDGEPQKALMTVEIKDGAYHVMK